LSKTKSLEQQIKTLNERVSGVEQGLEDCVTRLDELVRKKWILIRYDYNKDATPSNKSSWSQWLNAQEEFGLLKRVKQQHIDVRPAFVEEIIKQVEKFSATATILTPPSSISDEEIHKLSENVNSLSQRLKEVEDIAHTLEKTNEIPTRNDDSARIDTLELEINRLKEQLNSFHPSKGDTTQATSTSEVESLKKAISELKGTVDDNSMKVNEIYEKMRGY